MLPCPAPPLLRLLVLVISAATCVAAPLTPPAFSASVPDRPWLDALSLAVAAEFHAPNACLELGERLLNGTGGALDRPRALALYEDALAGGSVEAAQRLARLHLSAKPPDHRAAFGALHAGAFLGEPALIYNVGLLLLNGRGVDADPVEGLAWLILADRLGATGGALDQARAWLAHDTTQTAAAESRAADLDRLITARKAQRLAPAPIGDPRPDATWSNVAELKAAAATGAPNACAELAGLCLSGSEGPADVPRAVALYDEAIQRGHVESALILGGHFESGTEGVRTDPRLAFYYYKIAAYAGNHTGQQLLGNCFVSGRGTPRDYIEGLAWLLLAANDGHDETTSPDAALSLDATRKRLEAQPALIARAEQRAHALQAEILRRKPTQPTTTGPAHQSRLKAPPVGFPAPSAPWPAPQYVRGEYRPSPGR